jgi:hypothetical protein
MIIPIVSPILFKERFADDDELVDCYLNGPVADLGHGYEECTCAVYNFMREAMTKHDPGDLGFPEVCRDYARKHCPEQYKVIDELGYREGLDKFVQLATSDEHRDLCDVFFVKEVYDGSFHQENLMLEAKKRNDVVICETIEQWDKLQDPNCYALHKA